MVQKNLYPMRRRSNASPSRALNRFEAESDSTSYYFYQKLKVTDEDFDVKYEFDYRFFAVFSVISQQVKCKMCDSNVTFQESSL